ncbi:hypothetical protein [Flavobacterium selenitireducens]|uniref:hypothetical protein n=1 Tax=Flavobacterium selenitireducens TaxID=2722704 RepID=UPI00168AB714|nr:hypothetical protein [Flavobacterium selenitireducens]MBD3581473.1 hypothetical protein [Flavobacterium selenitireducens]
MRYFIVITAFLFLLKPVLPVVEYALNYDYIVVYLCENRAEPEMQCNGKCHLMKELAKASETEKPASQNDKKGFSPIELFCNIDVNTAVSDEIPVTENRIGYFHTTSNPVGFDGSVFHPPVVA